MKNTFIAILFIILTFSVFAGEINYTNIENSIKQYQQKVLNLQASIDKSLFNDEEIIISLDFDAEKIIHFLQDKFAFQPYDGLLRGVQSTLNSRAGNALDQSVLLAKLLGDAGFETRIVNGQLKENDALNLVMSLNSTQLPTHIGSGDEYNQALAKFTTNTKKQIDWKKTETFKRYSKSKNNLEALLKEKNILLENKDVTAELVKQTKEYFWVQYRMGESEEWKNAHPALKKDVNIEVKAIGYINDKVPEKYFHQLKVEAFIQQRINERLVTHSLMKPWIRPVANLNNFSLTYTNSPSGVKNNSNLDEIINKSNFFTPTFNGVAVGGMVFDLKGRLIDEIAMNAGSQAALFQTLGNTLEGAITKIDGKEKSETLMQLTSQWLQFTFITPNGEQFVQKRYLYETNDYKVTKQKQNKAKLALMGEYHFLVSSGQQSNAYIANTYLNLIEDSMPLLQASANKVYKPEDKISISQKNLNISSVFELLVQYKLMGTQPDREPSVIKYKAHANLIGIKRGYIDTENAFIAIDIISNQKNYFIKKDNKILSSIKSAFHAGIWETASEWLPSRFLNLQKESLDTLQVQSAANKQNIGMNILHASDLKKLNIKDNNILQRIKQEMQQGYTVIIPENKPNNIDMTGWWRVNLSTGETLGMTADGGGQSVTEYIIENAQIALSLIRALGNLKKCEKLTNDVKKMCCLVEAHINNVGGLAFGSVLGASVGTAASAVFDIADFATELATGSGLAPSTNGAICKQVPNLPNL